MRNFTIGLLATFIVACNSKRVIPQHTLNEKWLDSIKAKSDTNFTKKYRNKEFVTVDYYINRKDTTICQVMKDSFSTVRQIILARKNTRLFTAEYFANGQQKAALPLDVQGKFHGHATYYYESGNIKAEGEYAHGFYTGDWINYKASGEMLSVDHYDSTGQLVHRQ